MKIIEQTEDQDQTDQDQNQDQTDPSALLLQPWVSLDKLDWSQVNHNPHPSAIALVKTVKPEEILCSALSANPCDAAMSLLLTTYPNQIHWHELASNPHDRAVTWYLDHWNKGLDTFVCWKHWSANPNNRAIQYLGEYHVDKVHWATLSANPCDAAIALLEAHWDKIDWFYLSSNTHDKAIEWLRAHPQRIHWPNLCENTNDDVIPLLKNKMEDRYHLALQTTDWVADMQLTNWYEKKAQEKHAYDVQSETRHQDEINSTRRIDYHRLCRNTNNGVILLIRTQFKQLMDKVNWINLSANPCDVAVDLLLENPQHICWRSLALNSNPRAIALLRQHDGNLDTNNKMDWYNLSRNPAIFI